VTILVRRVGGCVDVRRVSDVLTITGVGVAMGCKRVRDRLGSESSWDTIASDNAAGHRVWIKRFNVKSVSDRR